MMMFMAAGSAPLVLSFENLYVSVPSPSKTPPRPSYSRRLMAPLHRLWRKPTNAPSHKGADRRHPPIHPVFSNHSLAMTQAGLSDTDTAETDSADADRDPRVVVSTRKVILSNTSGWAAEGQVMGILGPSGK